MRLHLAVPLLAFAGCIEPATDDVTSNATDKSPPICLSCRYCAIATFDIGGPAFFVQNFWSYQEAKELLAAFPSATATEIVPGPCDADVACPDYLVAEPICATVSGEPAQTFWNSCELLAATRHAAGSAPPDAAKSMTVHPGTCEEDACIDKKCGEECSSMFGSPLPTYCNAAGECRPSVPVCVAEYDCDQSHALCDAFTPACKDGETPSIVNGCYGPCVPLDQCSP